MVSISVISAMYTLFMIDFFYTVGFQEGCFHYYQGSITPKCCLLDDCYKSMTKALNLSISVTLM